MASIMTIHISEWPWILHATNHTINYSVPTCLYIYLYLFIYIHLYRYIYIHLLMYLFVYQYTCTPVLSLKAPNIMKYSTFLSILLHFTNDYDLMNFLSKDKKILWTNEFKTSHYWAKNCSEQLRFLGPHHLIPSSGNLTLQYYPFHD